MMCIKIRPENCGMPTDLNEFFTLEDLSCCPSPERFDLVRSFKHWVDMVAEDNIYSSNGTDETWTISLDHCVGLEQVHEKISQSRMNVMGKADYWQAIEPAYHLWPSIPNAHYRWTGEVDGKNLIVFRKAVVTAEDIQACQGKDGWTVSSEGLDQHHQFQPDAICVFSSEWKRL